jgi:hypothetical protein
MILVAHLEKLECRYKGIERTLEKRLGLTFLIGFWLSKFSVYETRIIIQNDGLQKELESLCSDEEINITTKLIHIVT